MCRHGLPIAAESCNIKANNKFASVYFQLKMGRLQVPRKLKEIGKENLKVIHKLILDVNYTSDGDLNLGQPHLRYNSFGSPLSTLCFVVYPFIVGMAITST